MRLFAFVFGAAVLGTGEASAQAWSLAPRLSLVQTPWAAPVAGVSPGVRPILSARRPPPLRGADSIWRREAQTGRGLRIGGVAGAMIGAGLGAAYLAAIQEVDESSEARSTGAAVAVVGGSLVVGTAMGMGIGAAIGSLFHRRVLVSP